MHASAVPRVRVLHAPKERFSCPHVGQDRLLFTARLQASHTGAGCTCASCSSAQGTQSRSRPPPRSRQRSRRSTTRRGKRGRRRGKPPPHWPRWRRRARPSSASRPSPCQVNPRRVEKEQRIYGRASSGAAHSGGAAKFHPRSRSAAPACTDVPCCCRRVPGQAADGGAGVRLRAPAHHGGVYPHAAPLLAQAALRRPGTCAVQFVRALLSKAHSGTGI